MEHRDASSAYSRAPSSPSCVILRRNVVLLNADQLMDIDFMPSYHITYFNVKERKIDEENIFMKILGGAKRSALHHSPDNTHHIEIKDLMEKTLARYNESDGWNDTSSEE